MHVFLFCGSRVLKTRVPCNVNQILPARDNSVDLESLRLYFYFVDLKS